ncbi:unnamed protein product [Zymoseptoria tritici ST99CH_1A5]|uniref:Ribosomal protein L19 n=2 Tax=Zymoseptoria tritici TaxID=1047171 RepID=A0A1X7S268_ZYMT9|nr:unnamed protein product [Zymoseptoria tritici ST99CH_3D7]SMY26925.1 unnamed protein product [Zymoseptoria tritici ST99CH_1A5]
MATPMAPGRPLAGLKHALRQCRAERSRRTYAVATAGFTKADAAPPPSSSYPSLQPRSKNFRPSQAIKQNRFEENMRKIPTHPPPRSTVKACPDPISIVTASQLTVLDPIGARRRLFAPTNPERIQPGDILHVRLKNGDPVSGVCLVIRQRNSPIDTSILLRNTLTRVAVEVWFKVFSPNIEGIEIVQRKAKRARRAKLYYMRHPKHDMGSVEGIVRQYLRQKAGGPVGSKDVRGRDANSGGRRKVNKKKK